MYTSSPTSSQASRIVVSGILWSVNIFSCKLFEDLNEREIALEIEAIHGDSGLLEGLFLMVPYYHAYALFFAVLSTEMVFVIRFGCQEKSS